MAELCPTLGKPEAADYDVWQIWMDYVLEQYGLCAARHAKTVQAWPR